MKSLKLLTICGATLMLVACTKDDVTTTASFEELKATQPTPVAFSTYLGESTTTRAAIDTDEALRTAGFGVFAYYTNDKKYPNTKGAGAGTTASWSGDNAPTPNFMYNQQVSYSSAWTYSPLKYWPNDFNGANQAVDARTSGTAATGSKANYLSFFAYAPYATPSGSETNGIKAFSANTAHTDPTVTYTMGATSSTDFVDLLWGVYNGTGKNVINENNSGGIVTYGETPTDGNATVNINLQKQYTNGAVGFSFKHALAKLGGITVDAFADVVRDGSTNSQAIANTTKITVTSVTVSTTAMPATGTLNLATGVWDHTGASTNTQTYTFNNGTGGTAINSVILEPSTISEWNDIPVGVPAAVSSYTPANLATTFPLITFFPGQQPTITVTIVYTVRTQDTALHKGYSEVEQTISKSFSFANPFEMNKVYNLAIHLGLTSVNFTASVSGWDPAVEQAVDLPINVATPSSGD